MPRAHDTILTEYSGDTRGFARAARFYDKTLAKQERLTNDRLSRVDRRWERSSRTILRTTTALGGLSAALVVTQVRAYAEAWRNVERRLTSIGQTSESAQSSIVDLALRTRTVVGGTAEAVQRMAKSTDNDFEKATRRVETLQKQLAVGGASGSERASTSLQLGQALKSGKLSGDEFRSISENAPVEFLDALAKAAGVTRKELKQVATDQKLTSDIVLRALDSLAASADESFRSLAVSGEEATAILTTGLTAYVGRMDESLGATATFNGALVSLGEYLAQSGEGAEYMASAIKIMGGAAIAAAGSRGIGSLGNSFRQSAAASLAAADAARTQVTASQAQVLQSRKALDAANARQRALNLEKQARMSAGKSITRISTQIASADRAQAKATLVLSGAQQRAVVASNSLAIAQTRLAIRVRLTTAALGQAKAVMAFFGGPVGLAVTAITLGAIALSQMDSKAEKLQGSLSDLSDTISKVGTVNVSLAADYELLKQKNDALAEAIEKGGEAAVSAATLEVDSIRRRINANQTYRKELSILAKVQLAESRSNLKALKAAELESAEQQLKKLNRKDAIVLGEFGEEFTVSEERVRSYIAAQRDLAIQILESGQKLTEEQRILLNMSVAAGEASIQVQDLESKVEALTADAPALGDGLRAAADGAAVLAQQAAAAQDGIAGLISMIPELSRAAKVQGQLTKAAADRDKALAGLGARSEWGPPEFSRAAEIGRLYSRAASEIDGTADAARKADKALDAYVDKARIGDLNLRGQALAREKKSFEGLIETINKAGGSEAELAKARKAHDQVNAQIEKRVLKKPGGGSGSALKSDRELASLQTLLVENGQKRLYIEAALNAERVKLLGMLPELISLGLSQAEAEAVVASQLKKVQQGLEDVRSASEEAAYTFARGILDDIRHAENLGDAIGSIARRLQDLAMDRAFDQLAKKFADLFADSSGGGIFGTIISGIFGGGASGSSVPIEEKALGGPVRAGQMYLVNEDTPNSEYFVPSVSGAILNVAQAQAAVRETSARANVAVNVAGHQTHIHNNASGVQVRSEETSKGRTDIFIERAVKDLVQSGKLDRPLKDRFSLSPKPRGA